MWSPPPQRFRFWGTLGTLWCFHHAEFRWATFDFPLFAFSLPFICLHRLWLQGPFRNGIGGDSVRTNHGFITVQPQLVSRALKTEILWKCMDTSRGLQQRVDTGSILILLLSHTNHTTSHGSSCIKVVFCCAHPLPLSPPPQEINLCMQHDWGKKKTTSNSAFASANLQRTKP